MGEWLRSCCGCATALLNGQRARHTVGDEQKRNPTWHMRPNVLLPETPDVPKTPKTPEKVSDDRPHKASDGRSHFQTHPLPTNF